MDHELHRSRRAALSPYFSGRMVQDLETRIRRQIETMRDVISEYLFGQSFGALDSPDFGRPLNDVLLSGVKVHPFARIFRPLAIAMFRAPRWMMPKSEILESSLKYDRMIGDMTRSAFNDAENEKSASHTRTIVHSQLHNDTLDPADRTFERIKSEGMVLVGAGTETTARTLATAIYHILATDAVHKRVLGEVRTVMPSSESPLPSVAQLQQLPYLTAVVNESLRIAHGVAGRLSRIAPDEDLQYGTLKIPRGVTFSQSMYYVHSDSEVYPQPNEFHPERFLGEDSDVAKANLWPFGKGTRSCLGINLAQAELFLTIAMVIGGVDMELVGTTKRDVLPVKEYFVGYLPDDSLGIRVKIRGRA
ncbi:uncharacterized protein RCC_02350 [Ramularia collo-cygni]|uniref:Cytochrome P450 n=1 Tax=Ramularia collo-cygni TaxID=112498 RepID=A0A2D3V4U8_9PEZI|nr:uncharacterized protein RCC_02350 [Ramularia collo-cygni]CZT16509.1 uncharacterized protein RCC_02350 [Ramularia collo-cygni]